MRDFFIKRVIENQHGSFGVFIDYLTPFAVTLEQKWNDNKPFISCIPPGKYIAKRSFYHHGNYECFEITGVPNRNEIKIHIANLLKDLEGCVGVAEEYGVLNNQTAILSSGRGFKEFMERTAGENAIMLYIERYY